jgi:hypothetical protein
VTVRVLEPISTELRVGAGGVREGMDEGVARIMRELYDKMREVLEDVGPVRAKL